MSTHDPTEPTIWPTRRGMPEGASSISISVRGGGEITIHPDQPGHALLVLLTPEAYDGSPAKVHVYRLTKARIDLLPRWDNLHERANALRIGGVKALDLPFSDITDIRIGRAA